MDDRVLIMPQLDRAAWAFLEVLGGIAPADWKRKPMDGGWSPAEIAEHITVSLRGSERLLTTRLLQMPLPPDATGRPTDEFIARAMADRTRRVTAPAIVVPQGRWETPEEIALAFNESLRTLVAWAGGVTEDLRRYGAPHPVLGLLDGWQWILFIGTHTGRHTEQMREVVDR